MDRKVKLEIIRIQAKVSRQDRPYTVVTFRKTDKSKLVFESYFSIMRLAYLLGDALGVRVPRDRELDLDRLHPKVSGRLIKAFLHTEQTTGPEGQEYMTYVVNDPAPVGR